MSGLLTGRVAKPRREQRVKNRSVLRMMAIMQDGNSEEVPKEFLETGRTGRRNAMPNVLHPQGAEVSTADLPSRLEQLVTTGKSYNSEEVPQAILETGRTGRRNATPIVLHPKGAEVSTADLPSIAADRITSMELDTDDAEPSTSGTSTKQDLAEESKEDTSEEASTSCS